MDYRSESVHRSAERLKAFEEQLTNTNHPARGLALLAIKRESRILLRRAFKFWWNIRLKGEKWFCEQEKS